jgi:uncharacterized SAM-binding protein YcdF (DUF218 family)
MIPVLATADEGGKLQKGEVSMSEQKGVANHKSVFAGLLVQRPRWGLSWKGWLLALVLMAGAAGLLAWRVHPFLAVTDRQETEFLVVEGWIDRAAIRAAVKEFRNGSYQRVFTTGGPVHGSDGTNIYSTSASIAAGRLRAGGIPAEKVQMVPSFVRQRDRTYSAAVALRNYCRTNGLPVTRINVLTESTHARRSRLLFQKAFGDEAEVGIISVPNTEYDAAHWWRYSEGVKEIISEGAAYLYVRLFFHPED